MQQTFFISFALLLAPLFFYTSTSHAHSDSEPPVDIVPGVPNSVEQNRAGYGWLNASSEVEADSLFRQECPRPNASGNISICVPHNSPLETAYHLADNNLEATFTRLAQENAYEYLILQRAAISPGEPSWDVPSCLADNPKVAQMKTEVASLKSKNEMELNETIRTLGTQMKAITDIAEASRTPEQRTQLEELKRKHLMAVKFKAVKESMKPDRMAQAFLLDKQLALAQSRACGSGGIPRKCMSIRKNRDRMRQAFPSVFGGGLTELEAFGNPSERRNFEEKTLQAEISGVAGAVYCNTTPYSRFEKSIYRMMGYNGAPNPIPGAGTGIGTGVMDGCASSDQGTAAIARGENAVTTAFLTDQGYRQIVSNTNNTAAYTLARKAGFDASRGVGTPTSAPVDQRMVNSYSTFTQAAVHMNHVQEVYAAGQMGLLCTRSNLRALTQFQPQAVRQAVLDQNDPRSREGLTRLMCSKGIMERFQADDQTQDCSGVTGDPNSPAGMTINRTNYGFPFSNDSNYKLTKLPDGSLEVATKINYRFTYDPSLDPSSTAYAGDANVPATARKTQAEQQAAFNTNTAGWVARSTAWYNSKSGLVADPKVKFKIETCSTCADNDKPRVSVSSCYRRGDRPSNFAAEFPGQAWDSHKCWYKNGVNKYSDWNDAGNFTTSMDDATIMHETGHNLSLSDEYVADYYPANPVAENGAVSCNSTMGSTNGSCHTLYARHLLEMTRPARACPRP